MSFLASFLQHPWVETLGWALLHFLWQGLLVAATLALVLWSLRRASANARYLVGLIALAIAAACPLGTGFWILKHSHEDIVNGQETAISQEPTDSPEPATAIPVAQQIGAIASADSLPIATPTAVRNVSTSSELAELEALASPPEDQSTTSAIFNPPPKVRDWLRPWLPGLVGLWLLGVVWFSLRLTAIWFRVQRLRRMGVQPISDELAERLLPLCEQLGIRRPVLLLGSWHVDVPTVIGWFRPVVLFPVTAFSGLTPSQAEALLIHELAHIRRWDVAVNLLQVAIETMLFYHPAVWWISRRIRIERENCCDDVAASLTGDEVGYVRALLQMAELHLAKHRIAVAASDGDLLQRAKRLLAGSATTQFSPGYGGVLVLAGVLGLLAAGIFQTVWAKPDQETKPIAETTETIDEIDYKTLTPQKILEQVEASMQRFAKVSYAAKFEETRNANAFLKDEVLPISGDGGWDFRTDGQRWRAEKEGFTNTVGQTNITKTHSIAGFDGQQFYEWDRGKLVIGEDPNSSSRLEPRGVFWNGARTVGWFLSALKSWNAKIDREVMVDGKPCLVIVSEPGQPKPEEKTETNFERTLWHYEITLSPTQSWLPLKTVLHMDGKLYSEERIEKLAQTPDGVWYPAKITRKQHFQPDPDISRTVKITRLELKDNFADSEFEQPLPIGVDIVDYSTGKTWHNDPWWADMEPWLQTQINWPRPSLSVLKEMNSYVTEDIDGKPAPEIEASQWLGEIPAGWQAQGRKCTVVMFFGGRAIHPTPQWVAALRVLQTRYKEDGLNIIGVATATAGDDYVKQTRRALSPNFPWAIDSKNEGEGNHFGKTFNAFKLRHYAGVLLVDAAGKMKTLESVKLPQNSPMSALEYAIRQMLGKNVESYVPLAGQLSDEEYKKIDAEWKLRQNAKTGQSQIRGQVQINAKGRDVFGEVPMQDTLPNITVRVRAIPMMQMLSSDTPSGWFNFMDYDHAIEDEFQAKDGLPLKNLRRGSYRMTIRPKGLAAQEAIIRVLTDNETQTLDLEFHQGDSITGQVVGTDGKPIAGATIKCPRRFFDPENLQRHTNGHLPADVQTDAEGKFTLTGLFVGAFLMEVSKPGYQQQTLSPIPAGKQNLEIVLRKPGEAAGVTKLEEPPIEQAGKRSSEIVRRSVVR